MEVLGRPLLLRLAGANDQSPWGRTVPAVLSRNLAGATGREDYVRVRLRREETTLWADPVLGPSGLLSPLVKSDGLVMIPLGAGRPVQGGRSERAVVRRVLRAFVKQLLSTTLGHLSVVLLVAS